jgi:hypothetical protein
VSSEWASILIQIAGAVGAFIVSIIGIVGAFYVKRIDTKLKMKLLKDEIKEMVEWSLTSPVFSSSTSSERVSTLVEQLMYFAVENGISITDTKLRSMIESTMNYPKKLEGMVLKSMLLKERKDV